MSNDKKQHIEEVSTRDLLMQILPYIIIILLFALPYIRLTHTTENTIRRIEKLKKELKDKRSEYITLKSEVMIESTESKLEKRLEHKGLKSMDKAPYQLKIKE
jgi:cell division protein FtsL